MNNPIKITISFTEIEMISSALMGMFLSVVACLVIVGIDRLIRRKK